MTDPGLLSGRLLVDDRRDSDSPVTPARPSMRAAAPFLAVAGVGIGSILVPPPPDGWSVRLGLLLVGFALVLVFLVVSLRRRSRTWVDPMPAFLFFGVLALARDVSGGSDAGLAPLVALPILWLAMTGTRRDLAVATALTAALFVIPMYAVGAPDYPPGDWRRAMLWTAIAALVAPVVQRLGVRLAEESRLVVDASAEMDAVLRGASLTSIIVFEVDGTIRSYSRGAEELLGHRAATMTGTRGTALFHDADEVARVAEELGVEPGFEVFSELAARRAPSRVWTFVRADGVPLSVQMVVTELRDHHGDLNGYLAVAIDVSEGVRAQRELTASEGRWRVLLDHLPDTTVIMVDEELTIRAVGGEGAWRQGVKDAEGRHLADVSQPDNMALLEPVVRAALRGEEGSLELVSATTGAEHEVVVTPLPPSPDGRRALLLARDVSAEHARSRAVLAAKRRAERLFADAPHGVALLRRDGTVVQANSAIKTMVGGVPGGIEWQYFGSLAAPDDFQFAHHLGEALAEPTTQATTDWTLRDADGQDVHVVLSSRVLAGDPHAEEEDLVLVHVVDVSDRRRYEQQLAHLAEHDALTGLANRRRFDEELRRHQALCERYGPTGALLVLDLDEFKEVNDSLGHGAGDQLIISTGALLRHSVRSTDVVARLGGDEFAVLLTRGGREDAVRVGRAIVDRVREHTATLDGSRRRVTASVGGVTFEDAARTGSDILALADMMMYDAKDAGRNRCLVLDSHQHAQPRMGARLEWKTRIERALENDDFVLLLQPIMEVSTGAVRSAEALLRLADGAELVPPSHFLEVAERAGLGPAVDRWVIRRSVEMLAGLRRAADPAFTLEVNLSGRSIGDRSIETAITRALHEHEVDPAALVLEITETAAVADVEIARTFAERMTALGTRFALDDFGAGFGSFYYLKHLLFDYVKIDGEFVAHCHRSGVDRTILRSIVGIARDLGKQTVAEYVDDPLVLDVVAAEGVDLAQGYHIGRPMPYDEFVAWARSRTPVGQGAGR